MKIWQAAIEVLKETGNDAVMFGDESLLHMIAHRSGRKSRGWLTSRAILNALSACPGPFVALKTRLGNGRLVRVFRLRQ